MENKKVVEGKNKRKKKVSRWIHFKAEQRELKNYPLFLCERKTNGL